MGSRCAYLYHHPRQDAQLNSEATIYEGILFGFALWKVGENFITQMRTDDRGSTKSWRPTLYALVLQDNLLYFFL